MSSPVTFENFAITDHSVYDVGLEVEGTTGVVEEMAAAFGHELTAEPDVDNLGGLIGAIGPAKELQENIGRVQDVLGTDWSAVEIAQGWVQRSGLLTPVARDYLSAEALPETEELDIAVVMGGVRNWMQRRATRLSELAANHFVVGTVLVGGTRQMKTAEGSDVEEGMTESDYFTEVVRPRLLADGLDVDVVCPETDKGDEVAAAAAAYVRDFVSNVRVPRIGLVSNAGAWVQNGGQLLRAITQEDLGGIRYWVASDGFPLGTGEEPTATHQNPFTALGQIARNAQELTRHQS